VSLPAICYLSFDSVAEGVGASQVLPYVERLGRRGLDVTLHSFETDGRSERVSRRLSESDVRWVSHRFGPHGAIGALGRIAAGATAVRGAPLVHARSDQAAAAALLAGVGHWVWDVRSFWVDQRISLGMIRQGSAQERVMRAVERRAAAGCSAVVTLTEAAIPVLESRHGPGIGKRVEVIPTCVDLTRFVLSPAPATDPLRLLLSGTLNAYYDVPLMLRLVELARRRRPVDLTVLGAGLSPWDRLLEAGGFDRASSSFDDMPTHVAAHHAGLAVCRRDAGVSLAAAAPTKVAEFLGCGRPVVVNPGLGDMDRLLAAHGCGVVVADETDQAIDAALDELEVLVDDPGTAGRCRALAEDRFDLDAGIDRLIDVYRQAVSAPTRAAPGGRRLAR